MLTSSRSARSSILAISLLAAASAAVASPLAGILHLHVHPASPPDGRVAFTVFNKSESFRDLRIDGKVYTVLSHRSLTIKAPVGTLIYAGSTMPLHRKNSVVLEVNRQLDDKTIEIN